MKVEAISDWQTLSELRHHWDRVYAADPEAHFFLSSTWMFDHLKYLGKKWFVLALKTGTGAPVYVAFLPLCVERVKSGDRAYNQIRMAGSPVGDCTGFLCMPEYQAIAMPAFAECLKRLKGSLDWQNLNLRNIRGSDDRVRLFLRGFAGGSFELQMKSERNKDGIDNSVCPCIDLPETWSEYLERSISPNMRQKLRRFLRQVEHSSAFQVTQATSDTVERDLKTLLRLWEIQWGGRKRDTLEKIKSQTFTMLMNCYMAGSLLVPTLWRDGVPIGALAILVDIQKKTLLFYMGGRDPSVSTPPPGLALHALSIRKGIQDGFAQYDFLRGDEPYKFSFGAKPSRMRSILARTNASMSVVGFSHSSSAVLEPSS